MHRLVTSGEVMAAVDPQPPKIEQVRILSAWLTKGGDASFGRVDRRWACEAPPCVGGHELRLNLAPTRGGRRYDRGGGR